MFLMLQHVFLILYIIGVTHRLKWSDLKGRKLFDWSRAAGERFDWSIDPIRFFFFKSVAPMKRPHCPQSGHGQTPLVH